VTLLPNRAAPDFCALCVDKKRSSDMKITLRLALFTTLMTLVYIGLAILGWGGFGGFFSHPARIAVTVLLFHCLVWHS
jgi:F0F1-type ATP synthase membrane subunit a